MPQNRDAAGRFIKGKSGNPGGRKALPMDVKEALTELVPEAIAIKQQILSDVTAPLDLRNRVADSVLDRVYGRPAQVSIETGSESMAKLDALLRGIDHAAE